jgi:1-acyl-sn-glycerol-3-phosphate acyltransferase
VREEVAGARRSDTTERILAQRSPILFRLFALYLHWYAGRHFHALRVSRAGMPPATAGRPVIVYSNHPSWWDPAIYILLGDKLFRGRVGYGPMDSESLGRYGLLRRMGVFGVTQNDKRGAALFLRTGMAVLGRDDTMLWMTAEGAFTDPRLRPIHLRPGLAHLARRVPGAIILPLALDYTFWNESRPEVLARFGEPMQSGPSDTVQGWTARLETALTQTMDLLAAESATRDPALFRPLVRGGAGIGGLYDCWRWFRATVQGRRFDPSHEGEP